MVKMETRRLDKDVKTHQVMLNDRIQTPDGKVFILDSMELTIHVVSVTLPAKVSFEASGRFIGTSSTE